MRTKVIVITGATRGCGRALVDYFAARDHTVLGCGRDARAIAGLNADHGAPHDFMAVDVRSESAVAVWAAHILENYGPPDILVNNAAVINANAPLWRVPEEEMEAVIGVNVLGMARVLRHFLPAMTARKKGVVVNFSSGWGRSVAPDVAPYCASKWAVEGMTAALARELPDGMAAVALNPGIIDTDMLRSCFGPGAGQYPDPASWAEKAGAYLLKLSAADNGKALSVPGMEGD